MIADAPALARSTATAAGPACPTGRGFAIAEDGVRLAFDVYGAGDPTIVLLPSAPIVHSRQWKAQVPYLARHFRVVTYDGRGNGRSDRPTDPAAYADDRMAADIAHVMDATGTDRAVLVGLCIDGVWRSIRLAADEPERVLGIVAFGIGVPRLAPSQPHYVASSATFDDELPTPRGLGEVEPPATGGATTPTSPGSSSRRSRPSRIRRRRSRTRPAGPSTARSRRCSPRRRPRSRRPRGGRGGLPRGCAARCSSSTAPRITASRIERAHRLAELTGAPLVVVEGADHMIPGRHPVLANLLIRDFVRSLPGGPAMIDAVPTTTWTRALARRRRALYISSPIGLGHAMRDVGDRRRAAQAPSRPRDRLAGPASGHRRPRDARRTDPPAERRARVRSPPTSPSESSEHDLNAFQAIRRMDEILVANFMVFHDAVEEGEYDLVIGDEAWDVDHYLHENPEIKRTAFAWMTDFVGWLPMPAGGEREAFLTADYNAEMIEHVERFPRIRDRAIFVGEPDDIVPDDFGPGLPSIRDWTERHYAFSGYVTGFDPTPLDRAPRGAPAGARLPSRTSGS